MFVLNINIFANTSSSMDKYLFCLHHDNIEKIPKKGKIIDNDYTGTHEYLISIICNV